MPNSEHLTDGHEQISRARSRVWLWCAIASILPAFTYLLWLPGEWEGIGMDAGSVIAAALVVAAVVRRGYRWSSAFGLFGIAFVIAAVGNVIWDSLLLSGNLTPARLTTVQSFYIIAIIIIGVAVPRAIPSQAGRGARVDDVLFLAAGVAIIGIILSSPLLHTADLSAGELVKAITPTLSVVLLAATLRIAFHPQRDNGAWWLMLFSFAMWCGSNVAFAFSTADMDLGERAYGILVTAAMGLCAAALWHPNAPDLLVRAATIREQSTNLISTRQVVALGAIQAILPMAFAVRAWQLGEHGLAAAAIGATLVALATSWRIGHVLAEREQLRRELEHMATHDHLTGLPNRLELSRALGDSPSRHALAFMDLDRFKHVNDSFGHAAGDDLLREVAARLRGLSTIGVTCYRLAGDEFIAVRPESVDGDLDPGQLATLVEQAVTGPVLLRLDAEFDIAASVGATIVEPGEDVDRAIVRADQQMYTRKQHRARAVAARTRDAA